LSAARFGAARSVSAAPNRYPSPDPYLKTDAFHSGPSDAKPAANVVTVQSYLVYPSANQADRVAASLSE